MRVSVRLRAAWLILLIRLPGPPVVFILQSFVRAIRILLVSIRLRAGWLILLIRLPGPPVVFILWRTTGLSRTIYRISFRR